MSLSLPLLIKLEREFYLQPTLQVAKQLIGKFFVRRFRGSLLVGKIVEVEAYLGEKDPASHAYNGKTKRNEVMFMSGGNLYVYFTYGMHFCCNVVTEREGIGRAVLLRAVEPLEGLNIMARHRRASLKKEKDKFDLCSGPAKLCEAFAIARAENATDLCGTEIWIAQVKSSNTKTKIVRTTRVGISQGVHHRWRFIEQDNTYVSKGKPS